MIKIVNLKNKKLLIIGIMGTLLGFILVSIGLGFIVKTQNTYSIILNKDGFEPSNILINKGDTVIFSTKRPSDFWPASDLHPEHTVYPDFDPRKPISQNESWSFTFTESGEYEFHDHLYPVATGVIRVKSSDGQIFVPENCDTPICWKKNILKVLKTEGVKASFKVFAKMYESTPGFQEVCHSIAHSIGEEAYELFVEDNDFSVSEETAYCGYGFYHSFMERLVIETGDMRVARDFCTYVGNQLSTSGPVSEMACYHGVGHGFTDGNDPRTWGDNVSVTKNALKMCEMISDTDEKKYRCGTGVYNGLAIARRVEQFGLSSSPETIFEPCEEQDDPLFKLGCYEQMNTLLVYVVNNDIRKLFPILENIADSEYVNSTIISAVGALVSDYSDINIQIDITKKCIDYFPQKQSICLGGGVSGILEFGVPGEEYISAESYCADNRFTSYEQIACSEILFGFMSMNPNNSGVLVRICDTLSERFSDEEILFCT